MKKHQERCILDKSNAVWAKATYSGHFYDSGESVAVWCNDDRRIIQIFIKIEDYFFHYFGFITKQDNLQMVTNNKLGKLYD